PPPPGPPTRNGWRSSSTCSARASSSDPRSTGVPPVEQRHLLEVQRVALRNRRDACSTRKQTDMHVVLFDIDGTLISSGGAGRSALEAGMAEEFGPRTLSDGLELSGRTDRAILHDLLRLCGLSDSKDNVDRLRCAYLRHLPARLHVHTTQA